MHASTDTPPLPARSRADQGQESLLQEPSRLRICQCLEVGGLLPKLQSLQFRRSLWRRDLTQDQALHERRQRFAEGPAEVESNELQNRQHLRCHETLDGVYGLSSFVIVASKPGQLLYDWQQLSGDERNVLLRDLLGNEFLPTNSCATWPPVEKPRRSTRSRPDARMSPAM